MSCIVTVVCNSVDGKFSQRLTESSPRARLIWTTMDGVPVQEEFPRGFTKYL